MGNVDSLLLPNNTKQPKNLQLKNTKRCDLCQKLINLDTNIFYTHDPINRTIQRCFFNNGLTHIAETFPTTIIDEDNFTACEECDEINSLSPPLFVKKEDNYTCSLCGKTVHTYLKSNSNATSRFDSFLCRDCFKKFCCYGTIKSVQAV